MLPTNFTKTLRSLDRSRAGWALLRLGFALLLLGALSYWMVRVPVALYETTADARLEIDASTTVVQAPMVGKITQSDIALGKAVKAGDILVRLDSLSEELQVKEQQSHLTAIQPEVDGLLAQISAEELAGIEERRASQSAVEEAKLRVREAETPAQFAVQDQERYTALKSQRLVSDREAERVNSEAEHLKNTVAAVRSSVERLEREQQTRDRQRAVRIAELRTQIAKLESSRASALASVHRFGYDVEGRLIRAPISGTIGEAAVLRPGSVLQEGTRVASIVPAGRLRIVALFSPQSASGRVKTGEPARLRLKGYPWTEFGVVEARVAEVAGEDRDGRIRVELDVLPSPTLKTVLRHGMPGELEVQVERSTPMSLVLRTAGQWLTGAS